MRQFRETHRPIELDRRCVVIRATPGSIAAAVLALGLGIWGTTLSAQSTDAEADVAKAECDVIDANGSTVVMVCPDAVELMKDEESGPIALSKSGGDACLELAPCIAWIWDDPANAPEKAPPLSDGLTREQVQSAIAVWVNDNQQLMTIARAQAN